MRFPVTITIVIIIKWTPRNGILKYKCVYCKNENCMLPTQLNSFQFRKLLLNVCTPGVFTIWKTIKNFFFTASVMLVPCTLYVITVKINMNFLNEGNFFVVVDIVVDIVVVARSIYKWCKYYDVRQFFFIPYFHSHLWGSARFGSIRLVVASIFANWPSNNVTIYYLAVKVRK